MNPLNMQLRKAIQYDLQIIHFATDAVVGSDKLEIENTPFHKKLSSLQKKYQKYSHTHIQKKSLTFIELKTDIYNAFHTFLELTQLIESTCKTKQLQIPNKALEISLQHLKTAQPTHWWPSKKYEAQYQLLFTSFMSVKTSLNVLATCFDLKTNQDIQKNAGKFHFLMHYKVIA